MRILLNIGLAVGTNRNIGPGTALRELENLDFKVIETRLLRSDTERTLVALVDDKDRPGQDNRINFLSRLLSQDCIAVYYPEEGDGALIGPRAAQWGEFNPEFFFLLDGTRLAQPLQRAA